MPTWRAVAGSGPDSGTRYDQWLGLSNSRFSHVRVNLEICRGTNRRGAARSGGREGGARARMDGDGSLVSLMINTLLAAPRLFSPRGVAPTRHSSHYNSS